MSDIEVSSDSSPLGSILRERRNEQEISLSELAEQSGYTKGHLSQVETGKELPSPKLIAAYERVLNLPSGSLLDQATTQFQAMTSSIQGMKGDIADGLDIGGDERRLPPDHEEQQGNRGKGEQRGKQGVQPAQSAGPIDNGANTGKASIGSSLFVPNKKVLEGKVIQGLHNTLEGACTMLSVAAETAPPANGQPIIINLSSEQETFGKHPELHAHWRSLLIQCLNKGWHVMHLRRIPKKSKNAVELVRYMIRNLMGAGVQYEPYFKPDDIDDTTTIPDMLLVPGIGVLQFLGSVQNLYIDSALIIQDAQQQELLRLSFLSGRSRFGKVLQVFPRNTMAFEALLSRKEASANGEILLSKDGFSTTLVPLSVLRVAVERCIENARAAVEDADRHVSDLEFLYLEREVRRKNLFARLEAKQRVLHIANKKKLTQLLDIGQVSMDDWLLNRVPSFPDDKGRLFSPLELAACLRRLLELMEKYPNYELRLDDADESDTVELFMEIVGNDTALFSALHTKSTAGMSLQQVDLAILEPNAISALRQDFYRSWERLQPAKKGTIPWIEEQIAQFESRRT